jgi:hypothetical protein
MENAIYTIMKWMFGILVISILGLNIFYYLEKPTQIATEASKNVIGAGIETTKQTVGLTTSGLEYGIEKTEKALSGALGDVEKALDIGIVYKDQKGGIQGSNQRSEKPGYCYIGKDKGIRSCLFVGVNDECMSDDIYPSMDICVNPKLRA